VDEGIIETFVSQDSWKFCSCSDQAIGSGAFELQVVRVGQFICVHVDMCATVAVSVYPSTDEELHVTALIYPHLISEVRASPTCIYLMPNSQGA
jgi:hypothetical protein